MDNTVLMEEGETLKRIEMADFLSKWNVVYLQRLNNAPEIVIHLPNGLIAEHCAPERHNQESKMLKRDIL
jgi:hypothetical protein